MREQRGRRQAPREDATRASEAHTAAVSWGYATHNGPARWETLAPAFSLCALGKEQSPIDLTNGRRADLPPLVFDYRQTHLNIANTGHTIQVNADRGSSIDLDGRRYALQQFHFHRGSEHTFDGVQLPLEMHLVHRSDAGALAVVAVLFTAGEVNVALSPLWAHLPPVPAVAHTVSGKLNLESLLPAGRTTWRYRGSLTTPPCTEGVAWVVMHETLSLSATQIDAFSAIYPHNCRPVQPIGERTLYYG